MEQGADRASCKDVSASAFELLYKTLFYSGISSGSSPVPFAGAVSQSGKNLWVQSERSAYVCSVRDLFYCPVSVDVWCGRKQKNWNTTL